MFWLGLLLIVCYVPGYTGASVPTQWVLLSAFLPACLWYRSEVTTGHRLFLLWIIYSLASLTWVLNFYSAVWELWFLFIWALAYHYGTIITDLRGLWKGLAVGLSISTVVALAQALDYAPVETADPFRYPGLLFNTALAGIVLGLVIVALVTERLWWYIPPLAIGLVLSGSRGGIIVATLGICAVYSRFLAFTALIAGSLAFIIHLDPADAQRLQIWGVTLNALIPFGYGIGSFGDLYYGYAAKMALIRPEYAHNDPLQLVYEFGIFAIVPIGTFILALVVSGRNFPVLFAWCAASLFFFPLYTPITAFIGCVLAGVSIRDWDVVRRDRRDRRPSFLSRLIDEEPGTDLAGSETVPMVIRTTASETT
jgi:hypothetical protein